MLEMMQKPLALIFETVVACFAFLLMSFPKYYFSLVSCMFSSSTLNLDTTEFSFHNVSCGTWTY